MKKLVAVLVAGIVLMTGMTVLAETNQTIDVAFGQIKLIVDGYQVDKETLLYSDTTYIPLRAAAEVLGKEVRYNDLIKMAYIDTIKTEEEAGNTPQNATVAAQTDESVTLKSRKKIDVIFGRIKLVADGRQLDKETLLYDGTTYIPLRAAAEVLGKEVRYDDLTKTAFISTPKAEEKIEEEPVQDEPVIEYYKDFPTVPTFESVTGLPKGIGTIQPKPKPTEYDPIPGVPLSVAPLPSAIQDSIVITYKYKDVSDSDLEVYYEKLKSLGFKINIDENIMYDEVTVFEKRKASVRIVKSDEELRLIIINID